jgi:hypothetical protein
MNLSAWFTQPSIDANNQVLTGAYWQNYTGSNTADGEPVYNVAGAVGIAARVEPCVQFIEDKNGVQQKSSHVIYTAQPIGDQDAFWVLGRNITDFSQARFPLKLETLVTKFGAILYYTIYLGAGQ